MSCFVLLVRHGRPSVDPGILYGSTDLPLSNKGLCSAQALAPILRTLNISQVVSSPLTRAQSTAETAGLSPKTIPAFREIHLGAWEMRASQALKNKDPQAFQDRWDHLETFRPPGGESFQDLADRVVPALRELLPSSNGILAIFGHLGIFRAILWKELDIPLKSTFSIAQDYCGIHVLKYDRSAPQLIRANWHPCVI